MDGGLQNQAQGPDRPQDNSGTNSSQSMAQSVSNSQRSTATDTTDQVVTPPASDTSGGLDGKDRPLSQGQHLLQLSAVAAAQDRLRMEENAAQSRKRTADGYVKGSASPAKGHSRTTSAVSMASTGSTLGEVRLHDPATRGYEDNSAHTTQLSAELRTRLSYAMVKVNHGWQTRSLDEVESLASQQASPASSTSTVHRRQASSSASPRLTASGAPWPQVHFAKEPVVSTRRMSNSPPSSAGSNGTAQNKPMLAPPAPIQPSSSMPAPRSNPRRNSNPHYMPTMLSHSHSASPQPSSMTPNGYPRSSQAGDPLTYSPHKNVREQDAIESLLFMSSPGNSTNMKHNVFSPHSGSPAPSSSAPLPPRSRVNERHALPSSAPRRGLPSDRPSLHPPKKVGPDRSPVQMAQPASPMDVDSHQSSPRWTGRPHTGGHHRAALSLPSGLGLGNGTARKALADDDIERMLDRAGADLGDSSDDEEIQMPRRGVPGIGV